MLEQMNKELDRMAKEKIPKCIKLARYFSWACFTFAASESSLPIYSQRKVVMKTGGF